MKYIKYHKRLFNQAEQRIITKCKKTDDVSEINNVLYDLRRFHKSVGMTSTSNSSYDYMVYLYCSIRKLEDICIQCLRKKFDKFKPVYQKGKGSFGKEFNFSNLNILQSYLKLADYLLPKQRVQLAQYLDTFLSSDDDDYLLTHDYKLLLELNGATFHKENK